MKTSFEIKTDLKLSFIGPLWVIKIINGALAPDNVKKFVLKQWIQENDQNSSLSTLWIHLTPSFSINSILAVIDDIFDSILIVLRLLTYLIDSDLFLL
ncbi:MAG: hypothetical protein ACFFCQ_19035 [Promethearchaeota archaeon]